MSVRCDFCIAPAIGYVSRALQGPFYCAAHQAKAEAAAAAHWAEIEEAQRHAEMEEAVMKAYLEYEHEVTTLILHGEVDGAMLLICQRREPALGITPKQAQLVRAGLAAGRLQEEKDVANPGLLRRDSASGSGARLEGPRGIVGEDGRIRDPRRRRRGEVEDR